MPGKPLEMGRPSDTKTQGRVPATTLTERDELNFKVAIRNSGAQKQQKIPGKGKGGGNLKKIKNFPQQKKS